MPRIAPLDAPAKRRPGRPAVAPDVRRERTLGVCVNAAEHAQLTRVAAVVGLKPSAFLRAAALGVVPRAVPAGNRERWLALGKLTGALTQLLEAKRRGQPVTLTEPLVEALRAEVRALRQELLGAVDSTGWADVFSPTSGLESPPNPRANGGGLPTSQGADLDAKASPRGDVGVPELAPHSVPFSAAVAPRSAVDGAGFGDDRDDHAEAAGPG